MREQRRETHQQPEAHKQLEPMEMIDSAPDWLDEVRKCQSAHKALPRLPEEMEYPFQRSLNEHYEKCRKEVRIPPSYVPSSAEALRFP